MSKLKKYVRQVPNRKRHIRLIKRSKQSKFQTVSKDSLVSDDQSLGGCQPFWRILVN